MNHTKLSPSLQFFITQFLVVLFWGIPEPFQKIPKILFLLLLTYVYFFFLLNNQITVKILLRNMLITAGCIIISYKGSYQTSLINIFLSSFAIALLPLICRKYTTKELLFARNICYMVCLLLFLQLLYFRTNDGRVSLGYEINLSGAYLFIFFIYCDIIKFRFGKFFVIIASLFLLSRLLMYAVILYYLIVFFKRMRIIPKMKLNWIFIFIICYIAFFSFNAWFLANMEFKTRYDSSINRVTTLNDGSNKLRFRTNLLLIGSLLEGDTVLNYGYGQISKGDNKSYSVKYFIMPHNELIDSIAEFGWILTLIFIFFSSSFIKHIFFYDNYEYIFPILFCTLILWIRFLIVPSLEMFYIFFLLYYNLKKNEINITFSERHTL